jgi:hypothetical protein
VASLPPADSPSPLIHMPNRVGEMNRPIHVIAATIRFRSTLAGPYSRPPRFDFHVLFIIEQCKKLNDSENAEVK